MKNLKKLQKFYTRFLYEREWSDKQLLDLIKSIIMKFANEGIFYSELDKKHHQGITAMKSIYDLLILPSVNYAVWKAKNEGYGKILDLFTKKISEKQPNFTEDEINLCRTFSDQLDKFEDENEHLDKSALEKRLEYLMEEVPEIAEQEIQMSGYIHSSSEMNLEELRNLINSIEFRRENDYREEI